MRVLSALALVSILTTACATQSTPPAAPQAAAKAPQCWFADENKFMDVGTKAAIAGVNVECKATGDGKSAQWMGGKH